MGKKFISGDKVYLKREILDSDWPEQYSKAETDTMNVLEEFCVLESDIDEEGDNAEFIRISVKEYGQWWYPANCFELANEHYLKQEQLKSKLLDTRNGILVNNREEKLKLLKLVNHFKIPHSYKNLVQDKVDIKDININYNIGYFSGDIKSSGSFSFRNDKGRLSNIITFQDLIQPLIDCNNKLKNK